MEGGRLEVVFRTEKDSIVLPANYPELIQGFIYRYVDRKTGKLLHNTGFRDPETGRVFKLFTFSRILPVSGSSDSVKFMAKERRFVFPGKGIAFVIVSLLEDLIQSLAVNLFREGEVTIGKERLAVDSVTVKKLPEYREKIFVRTLSPVTVYSTLYAPDGKEKKTYYYSPFEKKFEELVIDNLNKKYRALTGRSGVYYQGRVKPYRVDPVKGEKIITFKGTVIKAWDGIFELRLPRELFYVAFGAGIGAKNSQGFGCVEEVVRFDAVAPVRSSPLERR